MGYFDLGQFGVIRCTCVKMTSKNGWLWSEINEIWASRDSMATNGMYLSARSGQGHFGVTQGHY